MNWRLWNLSKITFAEDAWDEYLDIQREPFSGEGKRKQYFDSSV